MVERGAGTPDEGRELSRTLAHWAAAASDIFERCGRPDLADSSRALERRINDGLLRVAVIGDFKRGKSTLVNALIGDDVCSTAVTVSTMVPTVCRSGEEPGAWVIERRDREIRRRDVSLLEAHTAQDGGWPDAVAAEVTSKPSAGALAPMLRVELVDCPPTSGRRGLRGASVDVARSADLVLFVTDATQPLTGPEVQLLGDFAHATPTLVVVAKCDIAVHWRRVVEENRAVLDRFGIAGAVLPVAAVLPAADDRSGVTALLDAVRAHTDGDRAEATVEIGARQLLAGLQRSRVEQEEFAGAFGDRERLRARLRELESERDHCVELRLSTAAWQLRLDGRTETVETQLLEDLERGLAVVRSEAIAILDRIDPTKDWETFEPWLRDEGSAAAASVIARAEPLVDEIGYEVAGSLSASIELTGTRFAAGLRVGERVDGAGRIAEPTQERRVTRFVREGFATLGSTSGGLLAFATLGGVLSAAVLAPLTVAIGAGLGGTAVLSERRAERTNRQQRAVEAVDRYLDAVSGATAASLAAGIGEFRASLRDELLASLDTRSQALRAEVESVRAGLEDAEHARSRAVEVTSNVADIDDLVDRIRRRVDVEVAR